MIKLTGKKQDVEYADAIRKHMILKFKREKRDDFLEHLLKEKDTDWYLQFEKNIFNF